MPKITFLGAGSTVFAKSVLGDCIMSDDINNLEIALHDIDPIRLEDSKLMLENMSKGLKKKIKIQAYLNRRDSLQDARYIINAVQVGGYDPCTITDFEIPRKYGLRQTIADTLGIGGIFRALRTIPVLQDFAEDIKNSAAPDPVFLNYTNPMAILTGYLLRYTTVQTIGLCHSVQSCIPDLFKALDLTEYMNTCRWTIAGINHQAWLLKCEDKDGNDLYPEIKKRAGRILERRPVDEEKPDRVRYELMLRFGYYITESSEHNAEYNPWFIKSKYPELIDRYGIPLDEYPRRCIKQISNWETLREKVIHDKHISHEKTTEYAAGIISAMETDVPFRVNGNVLNKNLITNLPSNACVEVPCMIDRNGINPCVTGDLPEQCAAINRTNINVQLLTIKAALSHKKEDVYMAAMMDPHTAAELSMDDITAMCDDLFAAHKGWMPEYK